MSPAHWRRLANRYVISATTIIATALALGGILFFFGNDIAKVIVVGIAFALVTLAAWYREHPMFTSERKYFKLRAEVGRFIKLVSALNRAALSPSETDELSQVKEKMRRSLDRMAEVAGKEGPPDPE